MTPSIFGKLRLIGDEWVLSRDQRTKNALDPDKNCTLDYPTMEKGELIRFDAHGPIERVDRENGVIRGVSIITGNREASGHGVFIDETFTDQVIEAGRAQGKLGVKSRFDHPGACSRSMGTTIGRMRKFRRHEDDPNKVLADLHLLQAAKTSPDGDLFTHVLDLADEDPDAFGVSIVFREDKPETFEFDDDVSADDPRRLPHARLASLHQADVVDEPAANDGLFGRPNYWAEQIGKWADEHDGTIAEVLDKYFARNREKQQQEENDMEATELAEQNEALNVQVIELSAKVEELTTEKESAIAEGVKTGEKQAYGEVASRMESFKDAAFVVETIELSEPEAKDEFIKRLQAKRGGNGQASLSVSGGGDSPDDDDLPEPKTGQAEYDSRVAELMADGTPIMKAHQTARKELGRVRKVEIKPVEK